MNNFELSLVIPTYNAVHELEGCLTSIIERKQPSMQLIVIDGASTDGTLQILGKYAPHIDVLVSERDHGIYDAMNKALPFIKGKWVLFMGADDYLLPSFTQFTQHLKQPDTIYYGNCETAGEPRGRYSGSYRLAKQNLCHQAIFYPRSVFDKYAYQTQYRVFADYVLNMQCWGDPAFKKQYLPINVSYYGVYGFSSYERDPAFRKDKPQLVRQHLGWWTYLRYCFKKLKESRKKNSQFF